MTRTPTFGEVRHDPAATPGPYGLIAEFLHDDEIVAAARAARDAGYVCIDAYAPFPVHGLAEALGAKASRLPFITLVGGLLGGAAGYLMQYWTAVVYYPLNIGGRPYHSWPAFIPVTFECTILGASLATVLGMFILNGLPRPYHPTFNAADFERASQDRFFLCIEARDPKFDPVETRRFLEGLNPHRVTEVPE